MSEYKYWYMQENEDTKLKIRNYGYADDAQHAIKQAKQKAKDCNEKLVRVWIAFLEADNPVFTLIFGRGQDGENEMPLDNASKGIIAYNRDIRNMGKKKLKVKPRARIAPKKPKIAPYYPYVIHYGSDFKKERENEAKS